MKKSKVAIFQIIKRLALACAVLAALGALSGCRTMTMHRDIVLAGAGGAAIHPGLAALEETVVRLDGAGASREDLVQARQQVAALERLAADPAFSALVAAWSGRIFLMEGRVSDARREHSRSQSVLPYNIPAQVLAFRLEQNAATRLSMIDQSIAIETGRGELLAERGRALFDLNRFFESVAAFDAAFVLLSERPFYEEAYRVFRDKAWELRNLDHTAAARTMGIALQGEITWRDLIEITLSETDLLRFVTAGRDWPTETLFNHLVDRAFIPHTQNTALLDWPNARPVSTEVVLRSGAAWFLWHVNAENRANRGLLTQYSSRFANMPNARSPIADVDIRSPFVDSILGSVESHFMTLPDGRHFIPYEQVSGSDYLQMARRL